MIRRQIQLTTEQDRLLRQVAGERGLSKAEVIRQALDLVLRQERPLEVSVSREELKRRSLASIGKYRSDDGGSVRSHDDWLVEAYSE